MRTVKSRGFTYVIVLFALAVFGLGLAAVGTAWSERSRREKETDLLRIGELYATSLSRYYAASPGSVKNYPTRLDDLLEDRRFVGIRRHLRTLYPDPVTGGVEWGLVRDVNGGIHGVYSLSNDRPLAIRALVVGEINLPAASTYRDWKFLAPVESPALPAFDASAHLSR